MRRSIQTLEAASTGPELALTNAEADLLLTLLLRAREARQIPRLSDRDVDRLKSKLVTVMRGQVPPAREGGAESILAVNRRLEELDREERLTQIKSGQFCFVGGRAYKFARPIIKVDHVSRLSVDEWVDQLYDRLIAASEMQAAIGLPAAGQRGAEGVRA